MTESSSNIIGFPIPNAPKAVGITEVINLSYDLYNLTISLTDSDKNSILVIFQSVIGFRVLDEGDLTEFWRSINSSHGWAFEITAGGWHDHEKLREGYFVSAHNSQAKEYVFLGCDDCVSVISLEEPKFLSTLDNE